MRLLNLTPVSRFPPVTEIGDSSLFLFIYFFPCVYRITWPITENWSDAWNVHLRTARGIWHSLHQMQQQQQQQQQQSQSVSDSCLTFSHSFPADVIWAKERFAANICYKEREKKNLLRIVLESARATNSTASLFPKRLAKKRLKDLKDRDPLSNLCAKWYELSFADVRESVTPCHVNSHWQSASRCPACWTRIEKCSREATDGIDLAAARMLHLATAPLSMARAARSIYPRSAPSNVPPPTILSGLSLSG